MALDYYGDNRAFVIEEWLPELIGPPYVKQVIRWAYGYDGSDRSYEIESDGSTDVPDASMNGLIKEPCGVSHDMLNRVKDHTTPDGHVWTAKESCAFYRKAMQMYGYPKWRRWIRYWGLRFTAWHWWR